MKNWKKTSSKPKSTAILLYHIDRLYQYNMGLIDSCMLHQAYGDWLIDIDKVEEEMLD